MLGLRRKPRNAWTIWEGELSGAVLEMNAYVAMIFEAIVEEGVEGGEGLHGGRVAGGLEGGWDG